MWIFFYQSFYCLILEVRIVTDFEICKKKKNSKADRADKLGAIGKMTRRKKPREKSENSNK